MDPQDNTPIPSTDVSYQLELATGKLTWDDALHSVYGYDPTEPINTLEWWTAHIHPDDAMAVNQAMDELMDHAITNWTVRYRFRRADNTYVLVRDNVTVVRNEAGFAVSLVGTLSQESEIPES